MMFGMFGIPRIHLYDKAWFETPEEAEQWVKDNPQHDIIAAYKEGSEKFKEYVYDEATWRNCDMSQYKALVLFHWRPRRVNATEATDRS